MPANYTVIQYVPDPVLGERVNVGVAGYFEGHVQTRFLMNWDRVKMLGGKGSLTLAGVEDIFRDIKQGQLEEMISTWNNSIQFTNPGASIYSVEQALDVAVRRFLVDTLPVANVTRSRDDVFIFARDTLRASVNQAMGRSMGRSLVRPHLAIEGRSGVARRYDLVVRRDKPIQVFHALSFAVQRGIEQSIQSAAFLADEVKDRLPMTIVYARPTEETPELEKAEQTLEKAKRTFEYLGANFIEENDFQEVAKEVSRALAA